METTLIARSPFSVREAVDSSSSDANCSCEAGLRDSAPAGINCFSLSVWRSRASAVTAVKSDARAGTEPMARVRGRGN